MESTRGLSTNAIRGDARLWKRLSLHLTRSGIYLCEGWHLTNAQEASEVDRGRASKIMVEADALDTGGLGLGAEGTGDTQGRSVEMLPVAEIAEVANAAEWDFERNKTILRFRE